MHDPTVQISKLKDEEGIPHRVLITLTPKDVVILMQEVKRKETVLINITDAITEKNTSLIEVRVVLMRKLLQT